MEVDPPTAVAEPAGAEPAFDYERRRPEETVLHEVLREHLETFLDRVATDPSRGMLPSYVESELRKYLGCGQLDRGFVRLHCDKCGQDEVVAFSCKNPEVCPSCGARRMAETAARLVDHVLRHDVSYRQWVLTLPPPIRYLVAYDSKLCNEVLRIFVRKLFAWQRKRARAVGIKDPHCGAVTRIQRAGSDIRLNPHFHTLAYDGVFALDPTGGPANFHPLAPPTDEEVARLATRIRDAITLHLVRQGRLSEDRITIGEPDLLQFDEPALAACGGASITGRIACGPRAGQRVERYGGLYHGHSADVTAPRCAQTGGFNLHAGTSVARHRPEELERLVRYMARAPLANNRMLLAQDGKVYYTLKRPYADGTTHVVFTPLELVEKVAALVAPPRVNRTHYHGILAGNARHRSAVLPEPPADAEHRGAEAQHAKRPKGRAAKNYTWAVLMRRVYGLDVTTCRRCGGRLRHVATIMRPSAIRRFLEHIGLPADSPPISPPRPPPEAQMAFICPP